MKKHLILLICLLFIVLCASCAKPQEEVVEFTAPKPAENETPVETEQPIVEMYAMGEFPYYETFDELVLKSDAILIGKAGEAFCKCTRKDWVSTFAELQVIKVIKGSVSEGNSVSIVQNGGEADGLRLVVQESGASVPYLQEGTEYLLFLQASSSVPEPAAYAPMNSFVIYEVKDETVSPVSSSCMFITKETPLDLVESLIENSLLLGGAEYGEPEIETIFSYRTSDDFESLEELAAASDAILIGSAENAKSTRIAETDVRTDTEIRIKEVIKGELVPNGSITIMHNGGEAEGLRIIEVEDGKRVHYPQEGTEYLLFLAALSSGSEPDSYTLMNSFVFYEIKDEVVSPVSFASAFITKPTPLEEVREQVNHCLSQTE